MRNEWSLSLLLAASLLGCSPVAGEPDGGVPDAGSVVVVDPEAAIDGYCQGVSERICAGLVSCGCDLAVRGIDSTSCTADRKSRCVEALSGRILADLTAGAAVIHEASSSACFAAIQAAAAACDPIGLSTLPDECARSIQASAALGAACELTGNGLAYCAGGTGICERTETSSLCVAVPVLDQTCVNGTCDAGFFCDLGVCKARVSNAGCGGDQECVAGQWCKGNGQCGLPAELQGNCGRDVECAVGLKCVEGQCAAAFEVGSACLGAESCGAARVCAWDPEGRKCGTPVAVGSACGVDRECVSGASCDAATSKCQPLPGATEPCRGGYQCGPGLACSDGDQTCATLPGDGATCFSGNQFCASGFGCDFDTNTCGAGGGDGEPCLLNPPDYVCAPGFGCAFESDGSFCRPVVGAGGTCSSDRNCASGTFCDFTNSTCRAALADGEACPQGNGCAATSECARTGTGWKCRKIPVFGERCEEVCSDGSACRGLGGKCAAAICGVE